MNNLTVNEQKVYDYLLKCDQESNRYQGYKEISRACGISKSTVAKCVKKLAEKELIIVESDNHWGCVPNFYRVLFA